MWSYVPKFLYRSWFISLALLQILEAEETVWGNGQSATCQHKITGRAPYPADCSKYQLCSHGQPWKIMSCPAGTRFNALTLMCDHAEKVSCSSQKGHADVAFLQHNSPTLTKMEQIRQYLETSAPRLHRETINYFNDASKMANNRIGHRRPFRIVQSLLGNTQHGIKLSRSAYSQLLCLQELKRRFKLDRKEIRTVMRRFRRLTNLIKFNKRKVTPDDERDLPGMNVCPFPEAKENYCRQDAPYRTFDGSCNNLKHPLWGKSMRALRRVLESDYADGISEPRVSKGGSPLPSARVISNNIHRDVERPSAIVTIIHMSFGQFFDHDVAKTAMTKLTNTTGQIVDVECGKSGCDTRGPDNLACLPIMLPPGDEAETVRPCLMFVRSQEVLRDDCSLGPREQLNQLTSYIDASMVYGSTKTEADKLRDFSSKWRGKLLVQQNNPRSFRPLLPSTVIKDCRNNNDTIQCFTAGDTRVNEQVALMSLHTVFHRYHNYVEDRFWRINPHWDGERLFQEARKVVSAVWQHIVYNEYLPSTLSPKSMQRFGLNLEKEGYFSGYDPEVNADTANGFQTVAFRFGHSQVTNAFHTADQTYKIKEILQFSEVFNRPFQMYNNRRDLSGVDAVLFGQISQRAETSDVFFAEQLSKKLFSENPPTQPGTDLPSLNIQRGRDHGIPGYCRWREWCGLRVPRDFDDLREFMDLDTVTRLQKYYTDVEDIDLFTGGLVEPVEKGGMVGPTFACMIGRQFRNYRVGDRFWYETPDSKVGFTGDQLKEIRKVTLARVLCDTMDDVKTIQKYVMLQPLSIALDRYGASDAYLLQMLYRGDNNERRPCEAVPSIDFNLWKENDSYLYI